MTHKITLMPGDGIGQEVIPAAHTILQALNLPLEFQVVEAGFNAFQKYGKALPDNVLEVCEASDVILYGAAGSPVTRADGYVSPIMVLRERFNLFASLRPIVGISSRDQDVDLLIVREITEGLYSRRERISEDRQIAVAERVITAQATRRVVKLACEEAMKRRRKLTIVHKANIMRETCGLFRQVAFDVVAAYPELEVDERLVDTAAMHLVQYPDQFDVVVTSNMFGDILSDLVAGLVEGIGLAPSANIGDGNVAVFEPVHGSAPDLAGQGIADPRAAILSAALAVEFLGYAEAAAAIKKVAYNIAHTGNTEQTTQAVLRHLEQEYHRVQV